MSSAYQIDQLREMIGREVGSSGWLTVDQAMIDSFASVTGDHQWIHIDPARAKTESRFGRTIAHGFLTLSMLSRLSREAFEIRGDFRMRINYGLNRLRFPAPVPVDARIRARFVLQALEDIEGGHQLTWLVTIDVEGQSKPALIGEWLIRLYR